MGILGVWIDVGVVIGSMIVLFYDLMIVKIIVYGINWKMVSCKMYCCLLELIIDGV